MTWLAAAVAAAALCGCSKDSVVGKWKGQGPESPHGRPEVQLTLAKDGKFNMAVTMKGGGMSMTMEQKGTWTEDVKAKQLTMTGTSALVNGKPMPTGGPQTQTVSYTLEKDKLTFETGGAPTEFTRVGE